ncbi:class II fumarate hydratase [Eubacterium sp. AB3007]|uniref:class II fumarate hydratase n=1 Tax=Eubacterium sp. AB3007 TaxID=1392487 RepID=UPI00048A3E19|nr:class II fumarate hydratase [Eubacterium sp. AB3007]
MENYRIEHDTMGEVKVPADRYWGAQTQRSLQNFRIGTHKMPGEIIGSFAILKKAAAMANAQLGMIDRDLADLIARVCDEVLAGKLNGNFPLVIYQTGSGTQSNMNVNEVVANRGNEIAGSTVLHPNDHVNKSQSSNDTFPTAMHIAALLTVERKLLPAACRLRDELRRLEEENSEIVKTGRTHLQDATPLTLGQEISGWRSMLDHDIHMVEQSTDGLRELALGGTAVGTGLNAHEDFGRVSAEMITKLTGTNFRTAENKFHSLTSKDALVFAHGALKALAADLLKIANDVRWLASGPRCGIGEINIPENEPGSSIMPGKVNPTQCEALTMVCVQVMGHDTTIGIAASQGNFELNVFMPVLIYDFLESCNLLAEAMDSFRVNCVCGITPNREKIDENMRRSLMLVTALNPHIGYENAAKIAKLAHREGLTLKEAALRLELLTEEEFDQWIVPEKMV